MKFDEKMVFFMPLDYQIIWLAQGSAISEFIFSSI